MAMRMNVSNALSSLGIYNDYYSGKIKDCDIRNLRITDLRKKHPDKGGDREEFARATACWDVVIRHVEKKIAAKESECKVCGGSGLIYKTVGGFSQSFKCKTCNGTGTIGA